MVIKESALTPDKRRSLDARIRSLKDHNGNGMAAGTMKMVNGIE